ncbi:MAG: hypothetical protein LBG60_06745 [Bifidobacteriaceae bacterium]|nr:hypothetical protein [Bifidobacteriaceae bacterium]
MSVPEDDPAAFANWVLHRTQRGGHPFEIMRGGNSTHVSLHVDRRDGDEANGFNLWLDGKNRIPEVVRSANALAAAGLAVQVGDRDATLGVLTGDGWAHIVPQGAAPRYWWYLFPGENPDYYINIPRDFTRSQTLRLIHRALWYPDQTVEELIAEGDRLVRLRMS